MEAARRDSLQCRHIPFFRRAFTFFTLSNPIRQYLIAILLVIFMLT